MKKISIAAISAFLAASFYLCAPVLSEEKAAETMTEKSQPQIGREDALNEIKDMIRWDPEIFDYVKELKKEKDSTGKEYYTFLINDKYVKLEDLEEKALNDALQNITQQANARNVTRLQEQMMAIRESQRVALPPQPPRPPSPPQQPPAPPRVPPPPPRR